MRWFLYLIFIIFSNVLCAQDAHHHTTSESLLNDTDKDYVLGAGDTVRISVYGSQDLTTEARVTNLDTINFPLLGDVQIGGLSTIAAEQLIAEGLKSGGFIKTPHVNLIVIKYNSQFVSVLGNVYKPGRFSLDRVSNLADALALAGGPTPSGSDIVTLTRTKAGKTFKYSFDIQNLLTNADDTNNPRVHSGDIVFISKAPVFYIYGEVQRPGAFKLERDMTVAQALSIGGGLTARGTDRSIEVKRVDKQGNLKTFDAKLGDLLLKNDVVVVGESWF